jgi:hypothetical protein
VDALSRDWDERTWEKGAGTGHPQIVVKKPFREQNGGSGRLKRDKMDSKSWAKDRYFD